MSGKCAIWADKNISLNFNFFPNDLTAIAVHFLSKVPDWIGAEVPGLIAATEQVPTAGVPPGPTAKVSEMTVAGLPGQTVVTAPETIVAMAPGLIHAMATEWIVGATPGSMALSGVALRVCWTDQ